MLRKSLLSLTSFFTLIIISFTSLYAQSLLPLKLYGHKDIKEMTLEMKKNLNMRVGNDFYEMILTELITKAKNTNDKKGLATLLEPLKKECAIVAGNLKVVITNEYVGVAGVRKFYDTATKEAYPLCVNIMSNALSKDKNLSQYKNLISQKLPLSHIIDLQSKSLFMDAFKKAYPKNMIAIYSFKALNSMDNPAAMNLPTKVISSSKINENLPLVVIILLILTISFVIIKFRG